MRAAALDTELVCICGCRFRCPKCQHVPLLRILATAIVDATGRTTATPLVEAAACLPLPTLAAAGALHVGRAEPLEDETLWIPNEQAAVILSLSARTVRVMGAAFARVVRRKRARNDGRRVLWYKPDLDDVARVRHECAIATEEAVRVYGARIEGRI